jgi:predicted Zn-dependent peptidase
MYKKLVLNSGLRVILVPQKNTKTVTVSILVGAGSKYEQKEENGISHFLEHMFFKGTKKRPTQLEVAEFLDQVGGKKNAFTSEEFTGYWAQVSSKHFDMALDWVSDIFLNSKLEDKEINKERGVIIEEINRDLDNPSRHVWRLWAKVLYRDQPAGRSALGEKEIIKDIRRKNFLNYLEKHYRARNTVICVAGNFDYQKAKIKIKRYFQDVPRGKGEDKPKVVEEQKEPNVLLKYKQTDQAHLCLGVRAYDLNHPDVYAQSLLTRILGGMMSSRIFLLIRGRGLAYDAWTYSESLTDTGFVVTKAGIAKQRVEEAIKLILKEYQKIKKERVNLAELSKAKENLKGNTILNLESSYFQALFYGEQELLKNKILTPRQIFNRIDKITPKDIQRVAQDIFVPEKLNLAIIGPFKDEQRFRTILKI